MMKRILLPMLLLFFTMLCLTYLHIDNMEKIEKQSNELAEHKIITKTTTDQ